MMAPLQGEIYQNILITVYCWVKHLNFAKQFCKRLFTGRLSVNDHFNVLVLSRGLLFSLVICILNLQSVCVPNE